MDGYGPLSPWRFSTGPEGWRAAVDAVPAEETKRLFWEQAVPQLSVQGGSPPPRPCVVVCRVTAPAAWGNPPGGPLGRAKGLLDALHDDRKSGPRYRDLPGRAPLVDDHPEHVCGLAVEVTPGEPRTEYLIGPELVVAGPLLASVPVEAAAPNDIVGTPDEKAKIAHGRAVFAAAVKRGFTSYTDLRDHGPTTLVIRHRPQRDEDNTWATWLAAVCGARGQGPAHWAHGAPLAGWAPMAVASVADAGLETPVVYEFRR